MYLSTQTDVAGKRFGEEKVIRWICEAGFDAIDYSMFSMQDDDCILNSSGFEKYILEIKKIAESYGVFFNQAHAPFPSYKVNDEEYSKKIFPKIVRSIEIAGVLGVKNIVVHPTDFGKKSEENLKLNFEFYNRLLPTCREYNVKVAVENMFGRDKLRGYIVPNICSLGEEFCKMVDMLDPDYFTACVDIGHAGLVGTTAPELIRDLGHDRLGCLHVHDNNYKEDKHLPPYFCNLDWEEITQALADIKYKGDFTFEADNLFKYYPEELISAAYSLLHSTGRTLISKIEEKW